MKTEPRVVLEPEPSQWNALARRGSSVAVDRKHRFRAQLGLPTDRPIVMTGHQPAFWHPGILSKYLAADICAHRLIGSTAWLVVDHDVNAWNELSVPVRSGRSASEPGKLARRTWRYAPRPRGDVPAASCPSFDPVPFDDRDTAALDCVRDGLQKIEFALRSRRGEQNAARQVSLAVGDCLVRPSKDGIPLLNASPIVFSTDLAGTELFLDIVERFRRDPRRAVEAYNRAVARYPKARVQPLMSEGAGIEAPLWRLRPGEARRRVFADDLGDSYAKHGRLAPRALLLTAIMRLAGCDLFIHGRGGALYDQITEAWIGDWLGESLAPAVAVTADVLLPLDDSESVSEPPETSIWRAHRARHDPSLLGDEAGATLKRSHLAEIEALRRERRDAKGAFLAMHETLRRYRTSRARDLAELQAKADAARALARESAIMHDRTWSFAMYPPADLERLKRAIEARFPGVE